MLSFHNYLIAFTLPSIYLFFGVVFAHQTGGFQRCKLVLFKRDSKIVDGRNRIEVFSSVERKRVLFLFFAIKIWFKILYFLIFQLFAQVILISAINAMGASIYIYMQFQQVDEFIIVAAHFCWSQAHGKHCTVH